MEALDALCRCKCRYVEAWRYGGMEFWSPEGALKACRTRAERVQMWRHRALELWSSRIALLT